MVLFAFEGNDYVLVINFCFRENSISTSRIKTKLIKEEASVLATRYQTLPN